MSVTCIEGYRATKVLHSVFPCVPEMKCIIKGEYGPSISIMFSSLYWFLILNKVTFFILCSFCPRRNEGVIASIFIFKFMSLWHLRVYSGLYYN